MSTLDEIKRMLERLASSEREAISTWLQQLTDTEYRWPRVAESAAQYGEIAPRFMTLDEYIAFEERSPVRHEYLNGVLYAMSGASLAHYRITEGLVAAFRTHLRGGPCEAFSHQVVAQDDPGVIIHRRNESWMPRRVSGLDTAVEFQSIGLSVPLRMIYHEWSG